MLGLCCLCLGSPASAVVITHSDFQAVDASGFGAYAGGGASRVSLEGILLNSPEQVFDPTPDPTLGPWKMGGQWEIYIQGEGDDHAGTACWMGQNYGNGIEMDYLRWPSPLGSMTVAIHIS